MKEEKGLSKEEVLLARQKYGENVLKRKEKKSFLKSFISNLSDPIIRVLIIALFVNIVFMFPNINWFESGGILASIIIATLVSTISEYSSENAFEKLSALEENVKCLVKRDGEVVEIFPSEIVVGDIIVLEAGNGIYADAQIISGEISVDESALTGESTEIVKTTKNTENDERKTKALRGSTVLSGYALARVCEIGENTYYGKVAKELSEGTRPSPLKKRLTQLAKSISTLGYFFAGLIAFAYLFNAFVLDSHMNWAEVALKLTDIKFVISKLISALTLAISIVVVAVPEGLPMMITVVLSSNMKKMAKDNVLVRKLVGIETSGNINLLFTDKTGTLTEGKLKVKEIHTINGESYTLSTLKNAPILKKYVTLCANYCTNAAISNNRIIGSDATDRAVLEYFADKKMKARTLAKNPFDSTKKYSSCLIEYDGEEYSLFKGAPEKILNYSSSFMDENGEIKPLLQTDMNKAYQRLRELTTKSYRVVALGIKIKNKDTSPDKIVFLCFLAIRDRVRKEVPRAVKSVTEAGVGVIMITGDNIDTARAIAKECGIISPWSKRSTVIEGSVLAKMTDEEISRELPALAVIARALPSDKSRLVKIAQENGYVVGMTGDGINDASSLKSADVGFGMGSGTQVAKEASDIVISDNNLASIVKAVLYGRTIFESIRKFIVFQLTMNLAAVGISLLGPFIGVDTPVTITQMLWVNIIMDTLGALAFACEPPLLEYMRMPPKKSDEKIITSGMIKRIALNGLYVLFLSVWFLKSDTVSMILSRCDERYTLSAFFALFIFTGIFVCFTARTQRLNLLANLSKNKSFTFIMLLISVMQMAFIYFGGDTFRATPLFFHDLVSVILISASVVVFDLGCKILAKLLKSKKKTKNCHKTKKNTVCFSDNILEEKTNVIE
ncbi:MAG: calcium-translocating P-type ATPase, PMCA-type [Clostridia bacterium]|nr:calcium-translocating P-type ATPase, PMCA-type [Clostridia bacterium]